MSTTAADSIAGVVIPDSDLLVDHSRRVFLFGVLLGRRRGLQPDLEVLYAEAMFHDIGLTETYRTSMLRFEVDGAPWRATSCSILRPIVRPRRFRRYHPQQLLTRVKCTPTAPI